MDEKTSPGPAGAAAARAVVRIGVISDTHGFLDPAVVALFAGVDHVIHAGDIGDPAIVAALGVIAPVTAVAGNIESGGTADLPREVTGDVGGVRFVVAHKPKRLLKRVAAGRVTVGPDNARPDLVVYGHLHVPTASWVDGTLYLNPGSASAPDEEDDGPTVAIVERVSAGLAVRFVPLARRLADDGTPLATRGH